MSPLTLVKPLAVALTVAFSAPAAAGMTQEQVNETLRGTPSIYNALFTAAVIHHIVETCDALDGPNRLSRVAFFLPLYREARGMGFSRAEIESFVEDDAEQERMRQLVYSHLERQGVAHDNEAAVCAFGRAQIADGNAIGRRLSER